ncbi:MAG: transcriptional repressor [Deltaproteobacteria bacterium]|nr:transcriptional repressor [Deltaproteobacteria bacterium]MBZ0219122.1 transcriptional repressor [Deltaproteobacteria bacterium]
MQRDLDRILSEIAGRGFRLTRVRKAIVEIFLKRGLPLSASDIIGALLSKDKDTAANKTTVYRELAFLEEHGIIKEIRFLHERVKRYELAGGEHHHHLICVKCRKVEDIVLEGDLEEEERRILESTGFTVLNHSLEFVGLCQGCR